MKNQLWLYYAALAFASMAAGIHDSTFNNFLADVFRITADERGLLEFPRELPGFLVVMMAGVLCMIPLTRVGVIASVVSAAGLIGLAFSSGSYILMVMAMVSMSAGMHLRQPVGMSIVISLSDEHNRGMRMGQAGAVRTLFIAIGTGLVWLLMDHTDPQYRITFLCAAGIVMISGMFYAFMHVPHLHAPRRRLVVKRKYSLYYLLEFLAGARKQIFLTFGPWVLIQIYGLPAPSIAGLLMVSSLIGIVFKPLAGMAMDYFGERLVMVTEGLLLALVCLGYGYAQWLFTEPVWALRLACLCFILDEMLFATGNTRALYLSRLTETLQDLNSSLAMGISINHIASMLIPAVAGAIWVFLGYERLFLFAAGFALLLAAVSSLAPRSGRLFVQRTAERSPDRQG